MAPEEAEEGEVVTGFGDMLDDDDDDEDDEDDDDDEEEEEAGRAFVPEEERLRSQADEGATQARMDGLTFDFSFK